MYLVFKGAVHRTEKKTEIGLNQTNWDWTSGLFLDQSFAAWLLVFHLKKYCGTAKKTSRALQTLVTMIFTFNLTLVL